MKCTVRGARSRWVGPPVSAPKSQLSRSPSGRQRHYGAVELAGAGDQVNVNDVVEVAENKQQKESSQRHLVLVQVLSMWEDTFTGIFKFRARSLVQSSDIPADALQQLRTTRQASDIPADALQQLRTTRQASAADCSVAGGKTPSNTEQDEADEVFLTNKVKDVEVRFIVKPITLCVSTSATTQVSPERKGKMGPRLTHAFCEKSGDFHPLESTDPILKRARVRQANAVALASRADQEHEAAKSGKPIVKSNGWLLPKRGAFARRGGRISGRGAGGGVDIVASSSNSTGGHISSSSPSIDIEDASDHSGNEQPPNSEDGEWKEGEESENGDATGTDSDTPGNSKPFFSVSEGFTHRKSARLRKSQQSPTPDAKVKDCCEAKPENEQPLNSEDGEWKEGEESENGDATGTDSDTPESSKSLSVSEGFTHRKSTRRRKSQQLPTPDAEGKDCCEAKPEIKACPPPAAGPTFQRRRRVPFKKRQGLLPPRPRRLAMPPMAEEPFITHRCEAPPVAIAKSSVSVKVVRPVRSRMSLGLRPKPSLALPRSASMEDVVKATPQLSNSAKRKRSGVNRSTQGANRSDYPPLHTLVGKDYQTDIPDLLSADERKQSQTGTGAKMVWRSVQDWDPKSRRMLARYLHAAKGVVEAKQARPGVAVHVRLGGNKSSSGVEEDNTEIVNSYAVWAISSGREACGLVRVACSEMAQTDIPRSAIQRVQSQEQALAALVKARCVLDNFEPALQMLADDHASPESIEPWTIKQVRTLEKALVKEYDPSRRLHGWARSGIDMDREDFIDLAKVSEKVPGKTPNQVLSFYYRYLAAAEPLTDVVYGPEAAKARKQESISPVSPAQEADVVLPGNGRSTRGNANTTKPNTSPRQVSPGLCQVSAAKRSGDAEEQAPKPKPRIIRLSAPKPGQAVVATTKPKDSTTAGNVSKNDGSTKRNGSPLACDAVRSAPLVTPRPTAVSKHATNKATSGWHDRHPDADLRKGMALDGKGNGGEDFENGSDYLTQQRPCAARGSHLPRTFPPLPPDAEVFEVEDSDDADGGGGTRTSTLSASGGISGGEEFTRPSDMGPAPRHISSTGPAGLSQVARKARRQAAPAVAPESRSSGVLPMAPSSAPRKIEKFKGHSARGYDGAWYGYRRRAPVFPCAQGERRLQDPPLSHSIRHEAHLRRCDDGPSGSQVESGDIPSTGYSSTGYSDRRTIHVGLEPASRDDMFGSMAPCWRLLERAQAYMDKDQLEYMRGLILTHVRKPMSRDQLLERAESCLQEQDKIFAAFVKMFDRIDQPPQVPLYPANRALHPRPPPASYSVQRSPDAESVHTSPNRLPPPVIPPPRTFKAQWGDLYSSRAVFNDGDERGVSMSAPSEPYTRAALSTIGPVEVRRSTYPYDHDGTGRWRASDVGSTGKNDAVCIRSEPPPYRLSAGPHHSDLSIDRVGYPERRSDIGHGGGASVRKAWSQQTPGEWNTEKCFSAAATATTAAHGCKANTRSRGPAWGRGEGEPWS